MSEKNGHSIESYNENFIYIWSCSIGSKQERELFSVFKQIYLLNSSSCDRRPIEKKETSKVT